VLPNIKPFGSKTVATALGPEDAEKQASKATPADLSPRNSPFDTGSNSYRFGGIGL
jgi:hypothetical protein